MKSTVSILAMAALTAASTVAAAKPARSLRAECNRVVEVTPLLMLSVMAEGPMNCSDSHDGSEFIDCDPDATPAEKAAQARRVAVRQYQEAAYQKAYDACDAWQADRKSPALREAAAAAIAGARATDRGVLPGENPPAK